MAISKKVAKAAPKKASAPAKKAAVPAKKAAPAKKAPVAAKKEASPAKKAPAPAKKPVVSKAVPVKKVPVAKPEPAAKKTAPEKAASPKGAPVITKGVANTGKTTEKKAAPAASTPAKPTPVAAAPKVAPKAKATSKPKPPAKVKQPPAVVQPEPKTPSLPIPQKKIVPKTVDKTPVEMPAIKATGKVSYDPDFTVSVLDTPTRSDAPQSTPTMRYKDSELAEFKELILRKLEAARKELSYLQGLITRKDDMGGDNDDSRYMTMEDGSLSMEREQLSQMASRQITFIDHLEKALIRIENKTYGICRVTGKLIDKARLKAVPHATLSMEAKMGKVK
jgi:RNA polymerase-binding transcription factor DksA